jgi:hypothetical protein
MLKNLALAGVFFFASAISVSATTAHRPAKKASTVVAPSAPDPQGICPTWPIC